MTHSRHLPNRKKFILEVHMSTHFRPYVHTSYSVSINRIEIRCTNRVCLGRCYFKEVTNDIIFRAPEVQPVYRSFTSFQQGLYFCFISYSSNSQNPIDKLLVTQVHKAGNAAKYNFSPKGKPNQVDKPIAEVLDKKISKIGSYSFGLLTCITKWVLFSH